MEKKLNNMLSFSDFDKNWKPKESKKTKRTEVGLDIVKEKEEKGWKKINAVIGEETKDHIIWYPQGTKKTIKIKKGDGYNKKRNYKQIGKELFVKEGPMVKENSDDSITKIAKLIPYMYHHSIFSKKIGGEPELVYVDSDHKHPDPSKIMLWGWNEKGENISDFKRYFQRKGKPIEIPYRVPSKGITANSEKNLKMLAIKKWIETH